MALLINLRHLEAKNLQLQGELSARELEIEQLDEVIHVQAPLGYELQAQKLDHAVLVRGLLKLDLECECVRCLAPFHYPLRLADWICHLPLAEEEDRVLVVNDCIDLTPYIREDIVLAFPQHPLCKTDCGGLTSAKQKSEGVPGSAPAAPETSAWAALDKLKL